MNIGFFRLGVVIVTVLITTVWGQYQGINAGRRPVNVNYGQNPSLFRFPDYYQPDYKPIRRPYSQTTTTLNPINEDEFLVGNRANFGQTNQNRAPPLPLPSIFLQDDSSVDSLVDQVVTANNRFSSSLYNVIKSSTKGNFVFSSFSLASIICMLQAGTSGQTFAEIHKTMSFPENFYKGFQSLNTNLKQNSANSTFVTSNRLFIQEGLNLNTDFQRVLKEGFNSPAQQIDFSAKNAAIKINKLVAEDTRQQIPNLIDTGILNNSTRLLALNALYFKSEWNIPFHGRATRKGDFYKYGVDKIDVDMMNMEEYFKITDYLDSKAIVLPYAGEETEMIILVPNNNDGLEKLEKQLNEIPNAYDDLIKSLNRKPKNIVLHLPRFSLQSTHDLKEGLMQLGIKQAFNEYFADFSKMTADRQDLFLSKILQKAFLKVDEAGSEAGSASYGAVFTPLSIGPEIEETIIVDRPFLGFIRNTKNNLILFTFRKVE